MYIAIKLNEDQPSEVIKISASYVANKKWDKNSKVLYTYKFMETNMSMLDMHLYT